MSSQKSRRFFLLLSTILVFNFFGGNSVLAQNLKTSTSDGNWRSITWTPAGTPTQANDVDLGHTVTIQKDSVVHINNLEITNNGKLTIEGTLILDGNLTMENNGSEFNMGTDAVVIIYGDFMAANKVDVSISSYLIIHGDFTKGGSSGQGNLDIEAGNIYIFGNVTNWGNDFSTCEDYDGNTNGVSSEDCEYGTEDDFVNNPDIPEDLLELSNCFDLQVKDQKVCQGNTGIFTASENTLQNVSSYQWQTKNENDKWINIPGEDGFELVMHDLQMEDSGKQFRVVVKGNEESCKISISNAAELKVNNPDISLDIPSEICYGEEVIINGSLVGEAPFQIKGFINGEELNLIIESNSFSFNLTADENLQIEISEITDNLGCSTYPNRIYSVSLVENIWTGDANNNWNNPSNWNCNTLPTLETNVLIPENVASGNYPIVSPGNNALAKNLKIEDGANITVAENWLRIAGSLTNSGVFNTERGSVSFEGLNSQIIPSEAFENNRIENLLIDNTSGVTSEGLIEISGILKVENGNFYSGNALTLISSAEKTALIDGSGMGEVNGKITMQRLLDPAFGYKYFSSPFSETKAGDFTDVDLTRSFPNFYRYDENRSLVQGEDRKDATGWVPVTDHDSPVNVLEGYALNFGENNAATVVELTGAVNNGDFSRTMENNNREYTRGFHLIGNPYPSPIDWDAPEGWEKTNIEDGIYFFTAGETQYTGTYTSYVNGVSTSDGRSSNIIPSMQGFFVKVADPAEGVSKVTGTLTVSNKARVTDFDQQFLKTREREAKPLLRLTALYDGERNEDAMVIYFAQNTSTTFNKEMDAHKLMNTDVSVPNFYSLSEDKIHLSIKALPFPGSGGYEKIPLGITASRSGRMQINLEDLQNIPANWNLYLIDKETRKGQDLRKKPSYSFSIKEGEHHNRFQLMLSTERISDPAIAFDDKFSVDSRDFLKVRLNLEDGQRGELRVSTVTGQLLEVKEGRGKEQVEFRSITSSGIYFINLYVNDQRYSKKVLVNN